MPLLKKQEGIEMKKKLKKELDTAIDTSGNSLKWNSDPKGYFTIKPIFSQKKVFVRHYNSKNVLKQTFAGTSTPEIVQAIIQRKLISRLDHAAYLGKETEKAIIALKNKLKYIQGDKLHLESKELI